MPGRSAILRGVIALSLLAVLCAPPWFARYSRPASRPWPGYYAVLVRADADQDVVFRSLENRGLSSRIVAPQSEMLEFTDYSGTASVSLASAAERLEDFDPRYDNYMRSLDRYFDAFEGGQARRVFYVRSDEAPVPFAYRVNAALAGITPYRIAGVENGTALPYSWLAYAVMVLPCLFIFRRTGLAAILAALPCLPVAARGDLFALLFALIQYLACLVALARLRPILLEAAYYGKETLSLRETVRSLLPAAAIAATGLPLLALMSGPLYLLLLVPAAEAITAVSYSLVLRARSRDGVHRPFLYVPLHPRRSRVRRGFSTAERLALAAFACAAAVGTFLDTRSYAVPAAPAVTADKGEVLSLPLPKRYTGILSFSYSDLENLIGKRGVGGSERIEKGSVLPDIADYVIHAAYQAGFMYGRTEWRLPRQDENAAIEDFAEDEDGRLYPVERAMLTFSRRWLDEVLNPDRLPPLERMLVSPGCPVSCAASPYEPLEKKRSPVEGYAAAAAACALIAVIMLAGRRNADGVGKRSRWRTI